MDDRVESDQVVVVVVVVLLVHSWDWFTISAKSEASEIARWRIVPTLLSTLCSHLWWLFVHTCDDARWVIILRWKGKTVRFVWTYYCIPRLPRVHLLLVTLAREKDQWMLGQKWICTRAGLAPTRFSPDWDDDFRWRWCSNSGICAPTEESMRLININTPSILSFKW